MHKILFYNYKNIMTDNINKFINYANKINFKFDYKIIYDEENFTYETEDVDIIFIPIEIFDEILFKIMKYEKNPKTIIVKIDKILEEYTMKTILNNAVDNKIFINIPLRNGNKKLNISEIVFFENIDRKIFIKTNDDYFQTQLTLKQAGGLVEKYNFDSPYVSFIVNLDYIELIKGSDILLKNKQILPLSQKKSKKFKQRYKQYLSLLQ